VTGDDSRISGWLFPRLSKEHFSFDPSQEVFRRMQFLTNKNGTVPRWDDLLVDLAVSESARDELERQSSGVVASRREARLVFEKLDEYRRARVFFGLQKSIARELRSEKTDLDQLGDMVGEHLSRARGGANVEDSMMHFGGRAFDKRALAEMLSREERDFIPTGFRAFDSQNDGIPYGYSFLIAGETGAGKCVCYDTPVVTSEGVKQIGEVWDSVDTLVDRDGLKLLDYPLFVLSHTGKKRRVLAVYKTRGRPVRVTFNNGESVTGLPEHKLWVIGTDNKPVFRRLDEIRPGDKLPLENVQAALNKIKETEKRR
jgi:hypothetical protein